MIVFLLLSPNSLLKKTSIKQSIIFLHLLHIYLLMVPSINQLITSHNHSSSIGWLKWLIIFKLPSNLQYLRLGFYFNHSINHLPNSLHTLKINDSYTHEITRLPSSLTRLSLNHLAPMSIINSLKKSSFSKKQFSSDLVGPIPRNLKIKSGVTSWC